MLERMGSGRGEELKRPFDEKRTFHNKETTGDHPQWGIHRKANTEAGAEKHE